MSGTTKNTFSYRQQCLKAAIQNRNTKDLTNITATGSYRFSSRQVFHQFHKQQSEHTAIWSQPKCS